MLHGVSWVMVTSQRGLESKHDQLRYAMSCLAILSFRVMLVGSLILLRQAGNRRLKGTENGGGPLSGTSPGCRPPNKC